MSEKKKQQLSEKKKQQLSTIFENVPKIFKH